MNKLNNRGSSISSVVDFTSRDHLGNQKNKHRTHLFAFSVYDIISNSVEQGNPGRHREVELLFKKLHFISDRLFYLFGDFHWGQIYGNRIVFVIKETVNIP